MSRILHILTKESDALVTGIIEGQRKQAADAAAVVVIDLTQAPVDYRLLLQEVFSADSVECW